MLADDLAIYLQNYNSLPGLARVVSTYEAASGAATNWVKTIGFRLHINDL